MTTEEMIEQLVQLSMRAYKKNSRGSSEALRLDRKQSVEIDGIEFTCWREYTCYKVCEYLKDKCPTLKVELFLDGNNSQIKVSLTDSEQKLINQKMFSLIKEWG